MNELTPEQIRVVAEAQGLMQRHLRAFTRDEVELQKLMRHALFGLLACELDIEL